MELFCSGKFVGVAQLKVLRMYVQSFSSGCMSRWTTHIQRKQLMERNSHFQYWMDASVNSALELPSSSLLLICPWTESPRNRVQQCLLPVQKYSIYRVMANPLNMLLFSRLAPIICWPGSLFFFHISRKNDRLNGLFIIIGTIEWCNWIFHKNRRVEQRGGRNKWQTQQHSTGTKYISEEEGPPENSPMQVDGGWFRDWKVGSKLNLLFCHLPWRETERGWVGGFGVTDKLFTVVKCLTFPIDVDLHI